MPYETVGELMALRVNCPTCGQPFDIVPPEALVVKRVSMMEVPISGRPEPSKCSRCDYEPSLIESGVESTQ